MANPHNTTKIQQCSIERENKGDLVHSAIFNVQPRLSAELQLHSLTPHTSPAVVMFIAQQDTSTQHHWTPLEETVFGVYT